MANRRSFLQTLSGLPLVGGLIPSGGALMAASAGKRDYFKELGVRPLINAAGTYTALTASLMPPEVMDAINYASKSFVKLVELHDAVGQRIASLVGSEGAMVTAGAASALTLGTAACMTGTNQEFIRRLPDTTGMKNEVIIQKSHRFGYDHAIRNCGTKLIEVEDRDHLERSINERTVMMMFLNSNDPIGPIKAQEWAELGKKHNLPTFIDCAADVPPVENLSKFTKMGFSIVAFSGGKGIRGPQSAGLLLGKKELIQAARLNGPPNSDAIGRGMKVNKEELLGMMAAIELYVKKDHQAEWNEWEKRIKLIADSLASIKGITTETYVPEVANHVPHLRVKWDQETLKIKPPEVAKRLAAGEPSIEVVPGSRESLNIAVWMLQPGEAQIVAKRVREVLKGV